MRKISLFMCLIAFLLQSCEGPYGPDGYNAYGYNRMGYDRYGYDKNGYDSLGRPRPAGTPIPNLNIGTTDGVKETQEVEKKEKRSEEVVFGTGFAVCNGEYVLTAFHVIENADTSSITVEFPGSEPISAIVSKRSFLNDVALLKLEKPASSYLTFADPYATKLGQEVYTLGFPAMNVLGKAVKYTDGTVTSLTGIVDETSWMQVSVPTQPGSSGGPLLDTSGNIVGMIRSKPDAELFKRWVGTIPENVTWAIKAVHIIPIMPAQCMPSGFHNVSVSGKSIEETEKAVCIVTVKKKQ